MDKINISEFSNEVKGAEYSESDLNDLVIKSEIREENKIDKPPVLLEITGSGYQEYIPLLTLGNISTVKGKAKSRKTFASTLLMSASTYSNSLNNLLFNRQPDRHTLYFDTEQSEYHVYKTIQRVSSIRNIDGQSNNFWAFCLRPFNPELRTRLIEHIIYNLKHLIGLVVIDGVRDLIYDINSQKESVDITTKLMKWSKEKDCHILNVIHENKADGNARGHIGAEIQNKSETVLRIEKDDEYSKIIADMTRGQDFNDILFRIAKPDKCFIPEIIDYIPENPNSF